MSVNFTCKGIAEFNVCNTNARSMLETMGFNGSGYLDIKFTPTEAILERVRAHLVEVRQKTPSKPKPHVVVYRSYVKGKETTEQYESADHDLSPCIAAEDYTLLEKMIEYGIQNKLDIVLN